MQIIQNHKLKVSVNPIGAELASIVSLETGKEYVWQANPAIWGSSAPVLFPIIGALKNGSYSYQGKSYSLPKHGFVRYNDRMVLSKSDATQMEFTLQSDNQSLQQFPFDFEFIIRFSLDGYALKVAHEIHNKGDKEMWFSLGGHPAFNCPINEGEEYEDYFLEFEHPEKVHTWNLSTDGLIAEQGRCILDDTNVLPLHKHLFDHDALILKDIRSQIVSLKNHKSSDGVKVSFEGFPYLGIWAKPQAPYVCIEPWQGIADVAETDGNFENKEGIMRLGAGEVHTADFVIEILI